MSFDDIEWVDSNLASKGQRLGNYMLDTLFISIAYSFLSSVFKIISTINMTSRGSDSGIDTLTSYLLLFIVSTLYYLIFENTNGKTFGKMITKTKVVSRWGDRPTASQLLKRSVFRLIPFEALSFLGSKTVGWHDSLSNTRVIRDIEKETEKW